MFKKFQITGTCIPDKHYMVDIDNRIKEIVTNYIEEGKYFTINRARQFGKTTTLYLLEKQLQKQYVVISLSFEAADELFVSPYILAAGLIRKIRKTLLLQHLDQDIVTRWSQPVSNDFPLEDLGDRITFLCQACKHKIIFMIDEVDKSSGNQNFLSLLGLLRTKYLEQLKGNDVTFQSVILAGVYDIKNLKHKIHADEESEYNSPWNIAEDFTIDMSFHKDDIAGMLRDYEADYCTGMDIASISSSIYDYTNGYPYMVSRICKLLDERIAGTEDYPERRDAWTMAGFLEAVRMFIREPNTLFDDMVKKLADYSLLKERIKDILFHGAHYTFEIDSPVTSVGVMLGFIKNSNSSVAIANRIFETKLYNMFLSEEEMMGGIITDSADIRNKFIIHGMLQMNLVIEKFCQYFEEVYGDRNHNFIEEEGRRIFLMYLRPIINGAGNYYIEAQTRDRTRTDVIVDYKGRRFIIELKLWHGNEYNQRGEKQLFGYLDYYKQDVGYLLSFNFNKKRKYGIREIMMDGKRIVEAVV